MVELWALPFTLDDKARELSFVIRLTFSDPGYISSFAQITSTSFSIKQDKNRYTSL